VKTLRSPLGRVLGYGAAKEGAVSHWWIQRLTSAALVPLTIWFVFSLIFLPSLDHATVVSWMSGTWTALLLILLVLTATRHSQLGLQVVIEDYVHDHGAKTITLVLITFAHVLIAVAATFAILKVAFGGVQ
jgi:succinate dehydrogenase / fumarate reductase membrane anchor subunit